MADGWTITDDPLTLRCDDGFLFANLGCERAAADGTRERILVEIKSLPGDASVYDLHQAIGQLLVYRTLMEFTDPRRRCLLAVSREAFDGLLDRRDVSVVLGRLGVPVVVIDLFAREVVRWVR